MGVPTICYRSRKMDSISNPISNNEIKKGIGHQGKEKLLNTESCKKIESIAERKKILMEEKLCFNCAGKKHQA